MYSYGQFASTSAGRMKVRKAKTYLVCKNCYFRSYGHCRLGSCECSQIIPEDAYFEKPNVGGKDQHK
jgi:hypothetical protein